MLFDKPMILHSKQTDGRHWLTTLDMPPLQIWPVAPNHCRVGHFLATLISAKLASLDGDVPEEITLSRADVASVASLSSHYPELETGAGEVRIRLATMKGPDGTEGDEEEDDDPPQFITPQPTPGWTSSYDKWIVDIGRRLGIDVPEPSDEKGYEKAMANAAADLRQRLPALRRRFLAGMDGLNLGFKVGLATRKGGKEYVWVRPTDWKKENTVVCVLESQPRDCEGFKLGQTLSLSAGELLDYAIGSPSAGVVERGLTQRIAEDYGLVLS
jgi:hypothetical protein